MYSQFMKKFVKVIRLFYNDDIIIIRKKRRVKKSFKIFVKHISILSFIVILKEVNLFPSHLKNLFKSFINYRHYSFS